MDCIEALHRLGLTRQEALMYVTLLAHGPQTGYEAAKRCGVSRSNAYAALAGLSEKGGAMRSGGKAGKFTATPKAEFLGLMRAATGRVLDLLERELPERVGREEPYLTVSGHDNVVDKVRSMLAEVASHVYVSAHSSEAAHVAEDLAACAARGRKTVLICDADPGLPGVVLHRKDQERGHLRIIADTEAVLTGSLLPKSSAQCLYSRNGHLVRLMRESFLGELELIARKGCGDGEGA